MLPADTWGAKNEADSARASTRIRRGPQAASHDCAIAELSAEQGYEATKIADIVSRAGVARKTLYDNFDGKEDLFLSAFDLYSVEAKAAVEAACEERRRRTGSSGSKPGSRRSLRFVAEQPAAARMCLVEALSATPRSSAGYDAALGAFVELLRASAPPSDALPETIEETLVGGVAWILHQRIRAGETRADRGVAAGAVRLRPLAVPSV